MSLEFGESVQKEAQSLLKSGKDPNQIANILCTHDPKGQNYGIGILLGGDGKPLATSPTLLSHLKTELSKSGKGIYLNSTSVLEKLKEAVLEWQRIPKSYWDWFGLVLPSDAGTGAVATAAQVALLLNENQTLLGCEEWGWPAYKAIAETNRLGFKEYPASGVVSDKSVLPIYQAGPLNSTGQLRKEEVAHDRAVTAKEQNRFVILDRAYSGFEYASSLKKEGYDAIMKKSFQNQVEPFLKEKTSFFLALSPTKAFVTFSLRPSGFLLAYTPQPENKKKVVTLLNNALRARGSSFEHPVTRAFVHAMIENKSDFEKEHEQAINRLAQSEKGWRDLVKGTPIEYLFSDSYAGMFRNPLAQDEAPVHLYNQHLYPVFSNGRCRLNVTGLPAEASKAKQHVKEFADFLY